MVGFPKHLLLSAVSSQEMLCVKTITFSRCRSPPANPNVCLIYKCGINLKPQSTGIKCGLRRAVSSNHDGHNLSTLSAECDTASKNNNARLGLGKVARKVVEDIDNEKASSEELEESVKKRIPSIMRCFDRAKVFVKAGDGGNGVVAFSREKYVPRGGPAGGNGGRGGHVYFETDGSMNSLLNFRKKVHFRASRGRNGRGSMQIGESGEDVMVKVPPGTIVREAGSGKILLELLQAGQLALFLPGGRGGRGNASFKSRRYNAPKIAENGEKGMEM